MQLCSTSFLVGLPIVPKCDPEGDEEDTNDDDGGHPPSERGPVELEPCCPGRLINILELVPVRLPVLINRGLLGGDT